MAKIIPVYARRFLSIPLIGFTLALGGGLRTSAASQNQVQNEVIEDEVPDKNGIFLTVDQVLLKAKLGKISSAKLWVSDEKELQTSYYEFALKNGSRVYLVMPNDSAKVEKLENGLRTLPSEPVFITKGKKSVSTQVAEKLPVVAPSIVAIILILILGNYFKRITNRGKEGWKPVKSDVRFSDVRSHPRIIAKLEKIVKYITDASRNKVGARLPKGILLAGLPGTGKTLLARAVAGEANVPLIAVKGSEFVKMFAGLGSVQIDNLFDSAEKIAEKYGYCIVFIDELDAIGIKRSDNPTSTDSSREYTQALNQLLSRMDGFKPNTNVIVLAATNRPDVLDPALTRDGRFDLIIDILPPLSAKDRKDVLDLYLTKKSVEGKLGADVDIAWLSNNTKGFVQSALANLVNLAAIIAFENDKSLITMSDLKQALLDKRLGEMRGTVINEDDLLKIGVHEPGGHGIIGWACNREIMDVSVIPRGKTLGNVGFAEPESALVSKARLLTDLLILMGGRAAELKLLPQNENIIGARQDYNDARKIIRLMLSGGMFRGHTLHDYTNPEVELSKEDAELVVKILDLALETDLKIIDEIVKQASKKEIEALIKECIEAGELTGEEASAPFEKHLRDVKWEPIDELISGFYGNELLQ